MEITLVIFYYIYLALVGVFLIFTLFHLYHLFRFGFLTFGTIFFAVMFIGVTIAIFFFSWQALQGIDWSEPLRLPGSDVSNNYF